MEPHAGVPSSVADARKEAALSALKRSQVPGGILHWLWIWLLGTGYLSLFPVCHGSGLYTTKQGQSLVC